MGSRQPDDAPDGVLVLDVAPATPSSSALSDDAPDLPDNVTLFTGRYTRKQALSYVNIRNGTNTCFWIRKYGNVTKS